MKIKEHFVSVLGIVLLLLGATTVFKAKHIFIWKLSILATEYGHWFAALSLVFMSLLMVKRAKGVSILFPIAIFTMSLILFSRPTVLAFSNANQWRVSMEQNLQASFSQPLINFFKLWFPKRETRVSPQKIVFADLPSGKLAFDFYPVPSSAAAPWVMIVHGGGWDSGDASQFVDFNKRLVERGYAVAAVTYRLAPQWKWPMQKYDVSAAVSYIKSHAKEFGVDPDRWVILGRSAGGQIAEAIAYQGSDPTLKGLIAFYSPADLGFAYEYAGEKDIINSRMLLTNLLGGTPAQIPDAYRNASPIFFVKKTSPPTLLIHGKTDPLTWHVQSQRLYDRLVAEGAKVVYIELPWATHAFDFNLNGPAGQITTSAVEGFLSIALAINRSA